MSIRRLIPLVLAPLLVTTSLVGSARAAWPGYDGAIAFFGGDSAVYQVQPDGTGLHQVGGQTVQSLGPPEGAAWSQDGTKLAYSLPASDGHTDRNIVVDGHGVLETWGENDLGSATTPWWSADAKTVMFICNPDPNTPGSTVPAGICRSSATTTDSVSLVVAGTFKSLAWSPDGRRIAFSDSGHVYVADTDGTHKSTISSQPLNQLDWSPDLSKLIGVSGGRVTELDVATGSRTVLVDSGSYPAWSPDGKSIVYDSAVGTTTVVFVANADGSNAHALADPKTGTKIGGFDARWLTGPKPNPPVVAGRPSISGTAKEASTLTASPGTWNGDPPLTFAYQWQRCDTAGGNCAAIPAAASGTYVLARADVGSTIRVDVTATNNAGSASSGSDATGVVVALNASPTIQRAHAHWSRGSLVLTLTVCDDASTPVDVYATDWNIVGGKAVGKHARRWVVTGSTGCRSTRHVWPAVHRAHAPHRIALRARDAQGAWSRSAVLSLR